MQADEGQRALAAFEAMKEDGKKVNQVTWCVLMGGLLKCSQRKREAATKAAHALWQRFLDEEACGAVVMDQGAFACGINVCCESGDMVGASALLQRMLKSSNCQPDFRQYNMLIKGYKKLGEIDKVENVLSTMQNRGVMPTMETYNSVVSAHCASGNDVAALAVIEQQRLRGMPLDERAWGSVMQLYVMRQDIDGAEACLVRMQGAGAHPTAYTFTKLITLYADVLQPVEAKSAAANVRRQMLAQNVVPTVTYFNAMLRITLRDSRDVMSQASAAIVEMRRCGLEPTVDTCNTVMAGAMAQDDPIVSVTVFTMLTQQGMLPDAVTYTTLMAAIEGQMVERERVFKKIKDPDIVAYRAIIALYAKGGRIPDACRLLDRMKDICKQEGRKQDLMPAYSVIATAYARMYRAEEAVLVLRECYREGGIPDGPFLETVLQTCVATGKVTYAQQIVRAMQLSGFTVDVKKYQDLVDYSSARLTQQEEELSPQKEQIVVGLERFKFWLGMPNAYYNSDGVR